MQQGAESSRLVRAGPVGTCLLHCVHSVVLLPGPCSRRAFLVSEKHRRCTQLGSLSAVYGLAAALLPTSCKVVRPALWPDSRTAPPCQDTPAAQFLVHVSLGWPQPYAPPQVGSVVLDGARTPGRHAQCHCRPTAQRQISSLLPGAHGHCPSLPPLQMGIHCSIVAAASCCGW